MPGVFRSAAETSAKRRRIFICCSEDAAGGVNRDSRTSTGGGNLGFGVSVCRQPKTLTSRTDFGSGCDVAPEGGSAATRKRIVDWRGDWGPRSLSWFEGPGFGFAAMRAMFVVPIFFAKTYMRSGETTRRSAIDGSLRETDAIGSHRCTRRLWPTPSSSPLSLVAAGSILWRRRKKASTRQKAKANAATALVRPPTSAARRGLGPF